MLWNSPWVVIWVASGLTQLGGLCLASWRWWYAGSVPWRAFWLTFALTWLFTLFHHALWGIALDPEVLLTFLQGLMKLLAMLTEVVIMLIAMDLESRARQDIAQRARGSDGV